MELIYAFGTCISLGLVDEDGTSNQQQCAGEDPGDDYVRPKVAREIRERINAVVVRPQRTSIPVGLNTAQIMRRVPSDSANSATPDEGADASRIGEVAEQQRPTGSKPAAAPESMTDIGVSRTGMGNAPAERDEGQTDDRHHHRPDRKGERRRTTRHLRRQRDVDGHCRGRCNNPDREANGLDSTELCCQCCHASAIASRL
jgi:hypothetical protein